ncbi:hypothetical protein TNCV_4312021 [Trichonephila clavipes]|nr:hypothetical protein TNCV_4312021 [Trichonephila clavipes]
MNCLTAYQTLRWPARLPDPSPIKHVCDMLGSDCIYQEMLMTWSNNWCKNLTRNNSRDHQGALSLCHVVRQLASNLEMGQLLTEFVIL